MSGEPAVADGAARVYPPQIPAQARWPFFPYGTPSQLPLRASGLDVSTIGVALHAFAHGHPEYGISKMAAAAAALLDGPAGAGLILMLVDGSAATVQHAGTQILPDPAEANAWHAFVNLQVAVVS